MAVLEKKMNTIKCAVELKEELVKRRSFGMANVVCSCKVMNTNCY